MQTVLSITIPFFSIIFIGTFFRATKVFNEESSKIITKFAFFVTLPPYVFLNIVKSSNANNSVGGAATESIFKTLYIRE